jgi:hypothetical protein
LRFDSYNEMTTGNTVNNDCTTTTRSSNATHEIKTVIRWLSTGFAQDDEVRNVTSSVTTAKALIADIDVGNDNEDDPVPTTAVTAAPMSPSSSLSASASSSESSSSSGVDATVGTGVVDGSASGSVDGGDEVLSRAASIQSTSLLTCVLVVVTTLMCDAMT